VNAKRPELAWRLADFEAAGIEPPPRCLSNPEMSDGQMMTNDEVEEYIKDSIATLRILSDHQSPRYQEVADSYRTDLAYLVEVGSLSEDDYNELIHPDNLRF
jgi:hypothetical protein